MLVLVHAVRTDAERLTYRLVLDALHRRGHPITTIAWDTGLVIGLDLERYGPVRAIEDLNRWRLPERLVHLGATPVARMLRQGRVRYWWRQARCSKAVVVLGPIREEMRHYAPPGLPVNALVVPREPEPAESVAATAALADAVFWVGEGGPAGTTPVAEVLRQATDRDAAADPTSGPVIVGLGPADWRAAPDLFLRVLADADQPVTAVWIGADPEDGRLFPYRFDAEHLGVGDAVTWEPDIVDGVAVLASARVVLVTSREPHELPVGPVLGLLPAGELLAVLRVPVVAFDGAAADALRLDPSRRAVYPDTRALAERLVTALRQPSVNRTDLLVGSLCDRLLAS